MIYPFSSQCERPSTTSAQSLCTQVDPPAVLLRRRGLSPAGHACRAVRGRVGPFAACAAAGAAIALWDLSQRLRQWQRRPAVHRALSAQRAAPCGRLFATAPPALRCVRPEVLTLPLWPVRIHTVLPDQCIGLITQVGKRLTRLAVCISVSSYLKIWKVMGGHAQGTRKEILETGSKQ